MPLDYLFCVSRTVMGDCTRVLFRLVRELQSRDRSVAVISTGRYPEWFAPGLPFQQVDDLKEAAEAYEAHHIVLSNIHLLAFLGHLARKAKMSLYSQGYESFYYTEPEGLLSDVSVLSEMQREPLQILAASPSIQTLLRERLDKDSVQVGIAVESIAVPRQVRNRRILMSGPPLASFKGMATGFRALKRLAETMEIELVLLSTETKERPHLVDLPFPSQTIYRPSERAISQQLAAASLYFCSSHYEGNDLLTIQSFQLGTPVVSTENFSTFDKKGESTMKLTSSSSPEIQSQDLAAVLQSPGDAEAMADRAREWVSGRYQWNDFVDCFEVACGSAPHFEIEHAKLERYRQQMIEEGVFTPKVVYETCRTAKATMDRLLEQAVLSDSDLELLSEIRSGLKPYLGHRGTEYYGAIRSAYDLAGVLLMKSKSVFTSSSRSP